MQHAIETCALLSGVGTKTMLALTDIYRFAPTLREDHGIDNQ